MFDGYQVLNIKNKIKSNEIGAIGKELTDRIGSGNYDNTRTKYNIEFTPLCSTNLASSTYKTLNANNVEFNKKNKNINILNGCVISSGQDFFKSLGMEFEDTDKVYMSGKHEGEPIQKVVIKDSSDIPEKVLEFFKLSHEFMENYVGKENVIYSAVHFDEDTPHLQFYFTPVVHEVKRKVFETDKDGHQILKPYIQKDGKEKLIPIQKKDENSKNIYKIEKGNFLNSDQFWKDKGFKTSFAKVQDDYNKFITEHGFNLDRGEIGGNKHHLTKAEKQLEDLKEQNKLLTDEINKNKAINNIEISYKDKLSNVDTNPLLNPEKGKILGYKENDINKLSNYSKEITKDNLNKDKIIEQKEILLENKQNKIDELKLEIKKLKNGKALKEKDSIIDNQKNIIKEKDETINYQKTIINQLRYELTELRDKFDKVINNVKECAVDLYKALKRTLGFEVNKNQEYDYHLFKNTSKNINRKYEKDKSDDFEL